MSLVLADIRQAEDYDCGTAAMDTVCRFYHKRERGPVKLANQIQGMAPETVEALARSLGFHVISGRMLIEDLRLLTKTRPVMCCITHDTGEGHWVVVRGVQRGRVYFQCPTLGPRSLEKVQWLKQWTDRTVKGHAYDQWGICAYV